MISYQLATQDDQMNGTDTALARHHVYVLFGRLLMEGLTPELLAYVEEIPELALAVPAFYDEDFAAAHHQTIFGFNLFPFQSIFLDVTGLAGGREARRVQKFYNWVGFAPETAVDPDHIGQLLNCLAFLCQSEAMGKSTRRHQAELLGQHMLRWLLPFAQALKQQGNNFYTALANLLLHFAADHADDLRDELATMPAYALPQAPNILANKKTGWKEIAGHLLVPAYTGIYLGRDDVGQLAKALKLPRGFGERQQMLVNLFQSAIVYDGFGNVMARLQEKTAVWQHAYQKNHNLFPHGAALAAPWQDRTAQTCEFLEQLKALVA
jgi:nitrate reductase assembly molybdenum cofactor insertion protein NarJ